MPDFAKFEFASAPDSWGVLDYPGPSWEQSYENMLDEMVAAGYTGTELGPYGFFPTTPEVLKDELDRRRLRLLGSFVPVKMDDPNASAAVIDRIKKVGSLLALLKAPFLVMADDQSDARNRFSGRANLPEAPKLTAEQWKHVGRLVAEAERVAHDFGLDLVFHPHVATYVETPEECQRFFDVTSRTGIGLCLDTGHCYYGQGDPIAEAKKYASKLRFVHIKDCDARVVQQARENQWTFEESIEHKVFTVIGQGSLDFPGFFQALAASKYSGWCVVEQDVKFGDKGINPAKSVAESLTYLRGVVAGLDKTASHSVGD